MGELALGCHLVEKGSQLFVRQTGVLQLDALQLTEGAGEQVGSEAIIKGDVAQLQPFQRRPSSELREDLQGLFATQTPVGGLHVHLDLLTVGNRTPQQVVVYGSQGGSTSLSVDDADKQIAVDHVNELETGVFDHSVTL